MKKSNNIEKVGENTKIKKRINKKMLGVLLVVLLFCGILGFTHYKEGLIMQESASIYIEEQEKAILAYDEQIEAIYAQGLEMTEEEEEVEKGGEAEEVEEEGEDYYLQMGEVLDALAEVTLGLENIEEKIILQSAENYLD